MRRSILLAVMLVLVDPVAGIATSQGKIDKLVQKGSELVRAGDFEKAAEVFEEASVLSEGGSAAALVGLAMAYNGSGRSAEAVTAARQAVRQAQDDQFYWLGLGELTLALAATLEESSQEFEEALGQIRQLLSQLPSGSLPNRLRQRLCWARGLRPAADPSSLDWAFANRRRSEIRTADSGATPPRQVHSEVIEVSRADARRLGDHEEAVFQAVIDSDGCVVGGEIDRGQSTHDVWNEIAYRAMRRCVFEPAREGEQPVHYLMTMRFDYPHPFTSELE